MVSQRRSIQIATTLEPDQDQPPASPKPTGSQVGTYAPSPPRRHQLAVGLPQHIDEHRPQRPILLAGDQELDFTGLL